MAIKEHILQAVAAANSWLRGTPYDGWLNRRLPEKYVNRDLELTAGDNACMVIGPRQVGKSTLIWKTLSNAKKQALLLNCEEPAIREWLESPAVFVSDLQSVAPEAEAIFIEEAQNLREAGLFVKGVVDLKIGSRVFVTGSSSFHLESKTRESLSGRADRHLLLPFSLSELFASDIDKGPSPEIQKREILEKALVLGGYPSVHSSEDPELELSRLVEAFIIRDASDRFVVKNTAAFRKILSLCASQAGNLVNFSEWGSIAGVSNDTAVNYASLLEDGHVIRLVRPFVGGKRAEITSAPKVFFLDNGIRNAVFGGFKAISERVDGGAVAENFVFTELAKRTNPLLDGLYFWRNKSGAEVDFIVERRGELTGVEVKAGDSRGRISRSSRSFIEAYAPKTFLVINSEKHPPLIVGSTEIRFLRFLDLGEKTWLE